MWLKSKMIVKMLGLCIEHCYKSGLPRLLDEQLPLKAPEKVKQL